MKQIKKFAALLLYGAMMLGCIPLPAAAQEAAATEAAACTGTELRETEGNVKEEQPSADSAAVLTGIENPVSTIQHNIQESQQGEQAAGGIVGGSCGEALSWTLDEAGTLTISGTGYFENYQESSSPWYPQRSSIQSVVIETGVASIGGRAFEDCSNLEKIKIPDGVTGIGYGAFSGCSRLESIEIPGSVSAIGRNAFYECSRLESVHLLNGVADIRESAFKGCVGLKRITIPESVTGIGWEAFFGCENLTEVYITDIAAWVSNCESFDDNPLSSNYQEKKLFLNRKSLINVIIPEGVTDIGDLAFRDCSSLKSVSIPSGVVSIGDLAFYDCTGLESIALPDGVTEIGDYAFYRCSGLNSISIPDDVTRIGASAFYKCSSLDHVLYSGASDAEISISSGNSSLTDALWHYEAEGTEIQWLKNCENSGLFCALCNDFITRANAESGSHTYTDEKDVNCNNCDYVRKPEKYILGTLPDKQEYALYKDNLDLSGGMLWLVYDDGTQVPVDMTQDMVTGFDNTKLGTQSLDLAYEGLTTSWDIRVIPGTPDALQITTLPEKMTYLTGERLDQTGLCLKATYQGYPALEVPLEYVSVTAPDMTKAGTKSVVLRVGKSSVSYEITVRSSAVELEKPVLKASNVASTGKIKLTWDAIEGAEKYQVYRATSKNGTYSLLKTSTGTSFTNTSTVAGKLYYYKVRAVAGDNKSEFSTIVSRACDLPRPDVTVSNVASTGKIRLIWDRIEGAEEYQVYRSVSNTGKYSLLVTTTNTIVTNTSTAAGETYYYKVRAIHSKTAANSAFSVVDSRTCDLPRPDVTVSNVASTGKIKITWDAIGGAEKYQVYRATSKTGEYTLLKTTTGTSLTNTSAEAGKTYYYKVKAIHSKSSANSAYSAVDSRACDLPRPDVQVTLTDKGHPKLTWEPVAHAENYKVYRAVSQNGPYSLLGTAEGNRFTNTSAKAGITYYYKVRAIHSSVAANSAFSTIKYIRAK